jgi:hypothetical protein
VTWHLTDEQTQALPLNELALEILRDFASGGGWNRHNWLNEAAQFGAAKRKESLRSLAEGWGWLELRGLVATDPGQSDTSRFVTRLGQQVIGVKGWDEPWGEIRLRLNLLVFNDAGYLAGSGVVRRHGDAPAPDRGIAFERSGQSGPALDSPHCVPTRLSVAIASSKRSTAESLAAERRWE